MRCKHKEAGIIKELLKEIKEIDERLKRVEKAVPTEVLTKTDLRAIEKSESEIRKGKYVTAEQLKKELGIK